MRYLAYIFWIIVILFTILFSILNSQHIYIDYYIGNVNIYLPLLILIGLVIGAVLGSIAMLPIVFKARAAARKLKRSIKQSQQEINNLRTIPVKDNH